MVSRRDARLLVAGLVAVFVLVGVAGAVGDPRTRAQIRADPGQVAIPPVVLPPVVRVGALGGWVAVRVASLLCSPPQC